MRERNCRACDFRDVPMAYNGDEVKGLCRRCSWLEDALKGHRHPLPATNGVPIDFFEYPPIGPVETLS